MDLSPVAIAKHIDEEAVLLAIDPEKDVDGFHPLNMGRLWSGHPVMILQLQLELWRYFMSMGLT